MGLWRRHARDQHEAEAQAALANVAQHAQAGQRALIENTPWWSPPQMWSQMNNGWAPPPMETTPDLSSVSPVATLPGPVPAVPPVPAPPTVDVSSELVRVLDVVTTMCDHVIEYIEADRAERRMMIEALARVWPVRCGDAVAAPSASNGERVIGGSMPAGPDVLDIREDARRRSSSAIKPSKFGAGSATAGSTVSRSATS